MQYRRLGRYGLKVSAVSLGGWLTHGRTLEDQTTESIVKRALELGINLFDTADGYNLGEAEKSLGIALKSEPRENVVIATKCYFPMSPNPNDRGLSRKHVTESVHRSLKRLGTDYVDLMQFHRFDPDTPLDETIRAIEDMIRQGKVLYWGVSEWKSHQIAEAVAISRQLIVNPPASNQPRYSMLERQIEDSVMPTCEQYGLGLVVFSPLAQGVLTGKYLPGAAPPAGTRGADASSNRFMQRFMTREVLEKVHELKAFVEGEGYSMPQFALAWCLRKPAVSSVIIGATHPHQVEVNVAASEIEVDPLVWSQAEEILETIS